MSDAIRGSDPLERELTEMLEQDAPRMAPSRLAPRVMADIRAHRGWRRGRYGLLRRALRPALGTATSLAALLLVGALVFVLLSRAPQPPAASPSPPPSPGTVGATFPAVGNFPVVAGGSIWAPRGEFGEVVRIDPQTNEMIVAGRFDRVGQALAVRGHEVWATADDGSGWIVVRVDDAATPQDQVAVDVQPWAMAIDGDELWLTSLEQGQVVRVDLARRLVVDRLEIANPLGVAITEEAVWIAIGGAGRVARIDRATSDVIQFSTNTATTAMPMAVGTDIWVTTLYAGQVVVLSQESGEVTNRLRLQYPMGMVQHQGLIWIADDTNDDASPNQRIVAIDPDTATGVHAIALPGEAIDRGLVATDEDLWVVGGSGLLRIRLPEIGTTD